MQRELKKLTWTKIKKMVPDQLDTILLPVGTIEAHGAAALGTDVLIPEAIAASQAERLNALIAPTVNYGVTRSLYRYPGSSTIQPGNFTAYMIDVLNSYGDSRFKNIIILNGHGGNNDSLKQAAAEVHYKRRANIAVIHWWQLVADITRDHFGQAGGHAGIDETAAVQAIDPQLVDKDEYDENMAYLVNGGVDVYPVPGSILLYTEGEGYPNFDLEQARSYLPKAAEAVGNFIIDIIEKWKQLD